MSLQIVRRALYAMCLASIPVSVVAAQAEIELPGDDPPRSIGEDTTVYIFPGGLLPANSNPAPPGYDLGLPGSLDNNSEINLYGGEIEQCDSSIVREPDRGCQLFVHAGSRLNVYSGRIYDHVDVLRNGEASFEGGEYRGAWVFDGGEATFSGGWLDALGGLSWEPQANVRIIGEDFRVNGEAISGSSGETSSIRLTPSDFLSGRFADGRPFGFRKDAFNVPGLNNGPGGSSSSALVVEFTDETLEPLADSIDVAEDRPVPNHIGSGQTLRIADGADTTQTPFAAHAGSRVEISRGSRVGRFVANSADVQVTGGNVDGQVELYRAQVEMTGGTMTDKVLVYHDSQFDFSGGSLAGEMWVREGGRLLMSGGSLADIRRVLVRRNSQVTVFRGDLSAEIDLDESSEMHVIARDVQLADPRVDPATADSLARLTRPGDTFVITSRGLERGTELVLKENSGEIDDEYIFDTLDGPINPLAVTGTFLDGTELNWNLSRIARVGGSFTGDPDSDTYAIGQFRVPLDATARVTIGFPENYCDLDESMVCDSEDIDLLIRKLGRRDRHFDFNYDGEVDELDIDVWLENAGNATHGNRLLYGDANLDGQVDVIDLNIVGVNWQTQFKGWGGGDFDGSSTVSTSDLNWVGVNWQRGVPADPASVPEPASSRMILLGLVAMFWRKLPLSSHRAKLIMNE